MSILLRPFPAIVLLLVCTPAAWASLGGVSDPVPFTVPAGEEAVFRVKASDNGGTGAQYQWRRNGVDIPGATAATLRFTAVPADDGALYSCHARYYDGGSWVWQETVAAPLTVLAAGTPFPAALVAPPLGDTLYLDDTYTIVAEGLGLTWSIAYDNGVPAPEFSTSIQDLQRATFTIPLDPAPGSLTVTVTDEDGNTASHTWTVELGPEPPRAVGDGYQLYPGVRLVVPAPGIMANDEDLNGDALTIIDVGPLELTLNSEPLPGLGTVVVDTATGAFTYTPDPDLLDLADPGLGAGYGVRFSYRLRDATGLESDNGSEINTTPVPALVTLTFLPNHAVRAGDDVAIVAPGAMVDVDVLANDTDADPADTPTILAVEDPPHGTATIHEGRIRYQPDPGFSAGTDRFTYTVGDGKGPDRSPTVTIAVLGEGYDPGDLNGDGVVNIDDVSAVTDHFGKTYP